MRHERRIERDLARGETRLVIVGDFGLARDLGHGLVTGEVCRETWSIRDGAPLSAKGEIHWTETLEREGVRKFIDSFAELLDGIAAKRQQLVTA